MPEVLLKLKRILNAIPDKELKDLDLWINAEDEISAIITDDTSICLITEDSSLKVNDRKI